MRRKLLITAAMCLLIGGCVRDGGVIETVEVSGVQGKFVVEDDLRTAPLTATRHTIYYIVNNERHLIFKGAGGGKPTLSLLNAGTILVRYCGGRIEQTAAFIESPPSGDGIVRAIGVQPVTSVGISANGRPVC